jgi:putative DNA primase/helicase
MVKRVMEPGCKFDYCPVLEGPGGLRKSTMVETLASSAWYSDTPFEIGKGKESQEQVQGIWAYEMGELSQMGKSEITAIKAFITAKVDRYRPAYGRVIEEHPRQCVLVGTTNESTYLRDRTGNRRFWPIPIKHIVKTEWLEKYRSQLFAEAYALYMAGEDCIPSREDEERLFVPMQEARLIETAVTSELLYILNRESSTGVKGEGVNSLSDFVTLSQLAKALNVDAGKSNAGLEGQIRSWMNQQGWEYKKKQVNGVRGYGWERPKNWLADDQDESAEANDNPTPASAGASAIPVEYSDDAPF